MSAWSMIIILDLFFIYFDGLKQDKRLPSIVLKSKNFSAVQILREINFDHFTVTKIAILTDFRSSSFCIWDILGLKKAKIEQI